ncbi:hypothetical protein LZQ00_17150 [Sphingobacterium sp. SRCM116780]|uniref:hypothetical protein n=1 Tax=Sphingobacterium sp. SRCM116780 TaxID=2907623 RepID=UPI001F2F84D4|nr:hypothetical protein [Sphingobacterium sp. SRCM116780]UIR55977.1 hypothetical protein LZQ00_17150 [Sphingobacterium sp. SRCM116780]
MNKLKRYYTVPSIVAIGVELEQGIAAASANINPGNSSTPYTPQVTDWTNAGSQNKDFDL